ncbi:hypothetical protein [Sorangium sp. So ce1024]|uniref:hypothetical protein n=1 Tax=Sorangium sp. So ce1024 TaxID=3133327 RepID=UPI003F0A25B4
MRRLARRMALAVGLIALNGCSSPGELMIAVHTDLSVPEDIDTIKIEVFRGKDPRFQNEFRSFQLPLTLGLVAEEPGVEVTIKASAWAGPTPRIVREAVTTIPEERVALLHLPLHFLCDGSARDTIGPFGEIVAENARCGGGETCVAGACAPSKVDSASLGDYAPEDVFGGRSGLGGSSCFDVTGCFAGNFEVAELDGSDCSFSVQKPGEVNVALKTSPKSELRGICRTSDGESNCFVALDARSEAGFQHDEEQGRVALPPEVCTRKAAGTVLDVVWKAVGEGDDACPQQKRQSLPTCGPWSATGGG